MKLRHFQISPRVKQQRSRQHGVGFTRCNWEILGSRRPQEISVKNESDNPITITMQSNSGDRVPIVWSGKTVGYLEWSIVKYTPYSDSGGFITLSLYNDSDEYINFCITGKRANSCSECGWRLKPYQKNDEATFACSEEVSDFNFIITVEN